MKRKKQTNQTNPLTQQSCFHESLSEDVSIGLIQNYPNLEYLKCLSSEELINKVWYNHTREHYSQQKGKTTNSCNNMFNPKYIKLGD